MDITELLCIISCGEDSSRQFKKNVTNADSLAAEMVAFSNGAGGKMLIGVNDDGTVAGLAADDVRRLNQLISNAASQHVEPPVNPTTENIQTADGIVIIVGIPAGINKPYQDKNGAFWVKCGADKRKATSREEIQRIFQRANLLHADEMTVPGMTIDDLDLDYFRKIYHKRFDKTPDDEPLPLPKILENMKLLEGGLLTLGGALFFAKTMQYKPTLLTVKAGAFDSVDLNTDSYNDSRDICGKLYDAFSQTVYFILSNLHHVQGGQGKNSIGIPEIPAEAIEELVTNALIHRDYFISAPIRVFVFRDRVEIISPGHLPNNLTVENIKAGNSCPRNPVLASYANHILPYRGIGSGITYALKKYPDIDFTDDRDGNTFKVTLKRIRHDPQ